MINEPDMFIDLHNAADKVAKDANDEKLAQAQDDVRSQLPTMRDTGYPQDQYNYAQRIVDGHAALDKPDQPPRLQNKYIQPATVFVAGHDIATGKPVVSDYVDGGGFIDRGRKQLQDSYKTPDLAPPPEDHAALANLAFGTISEGVHDYEGFSAQAPDWPDDHKKIAWQAAQQTLYKLDLQKRATSGGVDAETIHNEQFPVWEKKATYDEVKGNPAFAEVSKQLYAGLSGREWEGDNQNAADFGMWWLSSFNWNLAYQADMAAKAKFTKNNDLKRIMGAMLTIDENMEMSWPQTGRNVVAGVADPVNLIPVGKVSGFIAKRAITAEMAKSLGGELTKMQLAKVAAKAGAMEAAPIGAAFGGLDEFLRETVKVESGRQKELSPASIATATALGAGAGAIIGGGANAAINPTVEYGRQIYKTAMDSFKNSQPNIPEAKVVQPEVMSLDKPTEADLPQVEPPTLFPMYHGSKKGLENNAIHSYGGSDQNIYGSGIYFTDSSDIAKGYANRKTGKLYGVIPDKNLNLFDMETKLSDLPEGEAELIERALGIGIYDQYVDFYDTNKNLRQIYDSIRNEVEEPAYVIQEVFDNIAGNLEEKGYEGYKHIGGLKTGRPPHNVSIVWDAGDKVKLHDTGHVPEALKQYEAMQEKNMRAKAAQGNR